MSSLSKFQRDLYNYSCNCIPSKVDCTASIDWKWKYSTMVRIDYHIATIAALCIIEQTTNQTGRTGRKEVFPICGNGKLLINIPVIRINSRPN